MKRNLIYLQFTENGLIILHNKELKEYIIKSVNNYEIINKDQFIKEISNILENNKVNNKILTDNINIITDSTYSSFYLSNLESLFKELSFNKIEFTNILSIINIKDDELIIEISTSNIKFLSNIINIKNNIYYFKHKSILSIYLKSIVKKHNIKTIYIIGNYPYNKKIIDHIERITTSKVYIYTQPNLIPIKLLI